MPTDDAARADGARRIGGLGLRSRREGATHVVELLGELDIAGAPELEQELLRVEATDAPAIVIDLGKLEFIDSTGVRMLLMAAERSEPDARLTLRRAPQGVHRVFEMTNLAERLPFADA